MNNNKDWRAGMRLQVETERFLLRSLLPKDVGAVYISWWNDVELQKGFNSPPRNWGQQHVTKHLQQFNNKTKFHLGIYCKETSQLIGFFAMFVNYQQKVAKTNVLVGNREYWGKNVVLEVRTIMLGFLFNELAMEKVEGEILGRNLSSIFNYQAQGFKSEGVRRSQILDPEGNRTDIYHFGLLKSEWQKLKEEKQIK
jgi:[ribosomal protein S5]-alanine N-acetyltransferase